MHVIFIIAFLFVCLFFGRFFVNFFSVLEFAIVFVNLMKIKIKIY